LATRYVPSSVVEEWEASMQGYRSVSA